MERSCFTKSHRTNSLTKLHSIRSSIVSPCHTTRSISQCLLKIAMPSMIQRLQLTGKIHCCFLFVYISRQLLVKIVNISLHEPARGSQEPESLIWQLHISVRPVGTIVISWRNGGGWCLLHDDDNDTTHYSHFCLSWGKDVSSRKFDSFVVRVVAHFCALYIYLLNSIPVSPAYGIYIFRLT